MIKVLIVEDSPGLVHAISMKLKSLNFECLVATDGEEALLRLEEKPDIVWLDIYLPKMSGFEFLKKVRESKEMNKLPVVVVTNSAGGEKRAEPGELGVFGFFV